MLLKNINFEKAITYLNPLCLHKNSCLPSAQLSDSCHSSCQLHHLHIINYEHTKSRIPSNSQKSQLLWAPPQKTTPTQPQRAHSAPHNFQDIIGFYSQLINCTLRLKDQLHQALLHSNCNLEDWSFCLIKLFAKVCFHSRCVWSVGGERATSGSER